MVFVKGNTINVGRKFSKTHRERISIAKKGKPTWMVGKKHSKKSRLKIKEARQRQTFSSETRKKMGDAHRGNKSHTWKGGITSLVQQIRKCFNYRQWRSDIYTRDKFTCILCGDNKGGNLEADHYPVKFSSILKNYNIQNISDANTCERLWDINNGRTLCKNCHIKTHKK